MTLKKIFIILGILLLGAATLVLIGITMSNKMFGPRINAVDNDPYLTNTARPALPLIQALERYYSEHHHYPSPDTDEDSMFFETQKGLVLNPEKNGRWLYVPENSISYSLYHQLNWDAGLFYRCENNEGHWEYDPGDGGNPVKTIRLNFDTSGGTPLPTPPQVLRH